MRPKRLFGFDGTAGEDPRSPTGLVSLGVVGLSPATAPVTLTREVIRELQGSVMTGNKRKSKKFIHEGKYAAEVPVRIDRG